MYVMKNLGDHIEELLQWHDCVVVPGVGGFLASYAEAVVECDNASESSVYPPSRGIRFNQSLTGNDGVLVHAYMTFYDAAYPSAERQMQKDVADMLDVLGVRGEYVMGHLGTLRQDLYGRLSFAVSDMGVTSPYIYGLPALSIDSLVAVRRQREVMEAMSQTSLLPVAPATEDTCEKSLDHDIVLRIGHRWVDVAVSAAAAVVFFFLLAYPSLKRQGSETTQVLSSVVPATELTTAQGANATVAQPVQKTAATTVAEKPFSIVLACYVSRSNAELFIEKMSKEGLREGRFVKDGNKSWILYSAYATKEAASEALQQLRKESAHFSEAWVIER